MLIADADASQCVDAAMPTLPTSSGRVVIDITIRNARLPVSLCRVSSSPFLPGLSVALALALALAPSLPSPSLFRVPFFAISLFRVSFFAISFFRVSFFRVSFFAECSLVVALTRV
jgi:hypothetical protein